MGATALSMPRVGRLIHANETRHRLAGRAVANSNAAMMRGRGIGRVIQSHLHDLVKSSDRLNRGHGGLSAQ